MQSTAESGESILRFYRWQEPTISLGYFQQYADRVHHTPSFSCPIVRRSTGGGAIIHDQELTYSFCTPAVNRIPSDHCRLYSHFHESLIAVLLSRGVHAETCGQTQSHDRNTFLCFMRRSHGDVLIGEKKVVGSAQRRNRRTILQHGSILLRRSIAAPELSGIEEIATTKIDVIEFITDLLPLLSCRLDLSFVVTAIRPSELTSAQQLAREKYGHQTWNKRK